MVYIWVPGPLWRLWRRRLGRGGGRTQGDENERMVVKRRREHSLSREENNTILLRMETGRRTDRTRETCRQTTEPPAERQQPEQRLHSCASLRCSPVHLLLLFHTPPLCPPLSSYLLFHPSSFLLSPSACTRYVSLTPLRP